ncbi:MAG: M23 family metallopeptidase, partial [Caldilineaceae bacterium]
LADPGGFGNYVKLVHGWGESVYAHMDSLAVEKGQQVKRGQVIGASGNTGFSGGPHLHFAIRIKPWVRSDGWGGFVDPLPYLRREDVILPRYVQPNRPDEVVDTSSPETPPHAIAPGIGPEQPGVARP